MVMDAVGSERPVLTGVFELGAPNALLAASKPERVHSMVWMEPTPRFAWAPDYPWGRTPADMEAELRDIDLWGMIAYGQAFLQDEVSRGFPLPDSEAVFMAKASRNACTPDVAGTSGKIWYESDVRSICLPCKCRPRSEHGRGRRGLRSSTLRCLARSPEPSCGRRRAQVWTEEAIRSWVKEIRRAAGVEPAAVALDRVLAAILFTDIVGSTEHLSEVGDAEWRSILARHDERARIEIERHRGRYGQFDGRRPPRDIRRSCSRRPMCKALGAAVRDLGIRIRAGVHTGEVERDRSRRAGDRRPHRGRVSARSPALRRCWSCKRSRTSSPAQASRSRMQESTSSRAFPIAGASTGS